MPLMLHGLLIAWMVMPVTRQVVQVGLCAGMTRTRCSRRVFLLGWSASTGEAWLPLVLLGTKQVFQCTFSWYSPIGMYLSAGRYLYILREAVSSVGVLLFSVFELPFFSKSCICLLLNTHFLIICACFTIPIFLMFLLVSQYEILYQFSLFLISGHLFISSLLSPCNSMKLVLVVE